ncbi:MAG TPA: zf-HC2 domain-containing protein [Gemmatimonadales bacterium]|nr:zf-HC2 domain-containing protein [Gemmatimonadales bacterium]
MSDQFTGQLSAFLDGELDDLARARLETHLGECLDCTRTLADLRAIVAAAPRYQGQEPARDLWQDIARRLGEAEVVPITPSRPGPPRAQRGAVQPSSNRRFGWKELIAASIIMAAVGGGAMWVALGRGTPEAPFAAVAPELSAPQLDNAAFADQQFDAAVRDLELLLAQGRDRLDSSTVRTIEQSLARIDDAILEARNAIQRDPANAYLSRQIAANMRRKLNLLRTATQAIAART